MATSLRGCFASTLRRQRFSPTLGLFRPRTIPPSPPLARCASEQKFYFKEYQQAPEAKPSASASSGFRRFIRSGFFYSFLTLGTALATLYYVETNFPISYPETGSEEDEEFLELVEDVANDLEIIKEIKSQVHPDGSAVWRDMDSLVRTRIRQGLAQTLRGTSRVEFRKYFWNEKEGRLFCVIHLGSAVSGWPRMVHGGMLATLLDDFIQLMPLGNRADEALGITAINSFPARTGVTANLKVQYVRPTKTEQFIIIKTELAEPATDRKALVKGQVLDLNGNVLVTAVGLFVVPKSLGLEKLQSFKDESAAK